MNYGQLLLTEEVTRLFKEQQIQIALVKTSTGKSNEHALNELGKIRDKIRDCETCLRMCAELDFANEGKTENDSTIIGRK